MITEDAFPIAKTVTVTDNAVWNDVGEVTLAGYARGFLGLNLEVGCTVHDMADFRMLLKDHANGEYYPAKSGSDWGSVDDILVAVGDTNGGSTGPNAVTAGVLKSHIRINLGAIFAVKFQGKAAVGTVIATKGRALIG